MISAAGKLRELLAGPGLLVVPECYSALTARLVETEGFKAAYCGGSAMAGMHLAVPDHGLVTTTELVGMARQIAAAITIPLIADADMAGETPLNVMRTIRDFERAGVAGVHLEDAVNPMHLGIHFENRVDPMHPRSIDRIQSVDRMCARIAAAIKARSDSDFVIIARTDELFNGGSVEAAIERGQAYAEAGADLFFPCRTPPSELARIAAAVPIPLVDLNLPVLVAAASPLKVEFVTGHAVLVAARIQRDMLRELSAYGEFQDLAGRRLPMDEYRRLVRDEEYVDLAWNLHADEVETP